jgi:hypothetical protein
VEGSHFECGKASRRVQTGTLRWRSGFGEQPLNPSTCDCTARGLQMLVTAATLSGLFVAVRNKSS